MKKRVLLFVFAICLCFVLAGCAQNGNLPYSSTLPSASGLAGVNAGVIRHCYATGGMLAGPLVGATYPTLK